ncbi:MAG TPA: restriction endonuclease [Terriglobia bacterium]|nr:restriction endonuclease [Terriglobia bacterium]
MSTEPVKPSDKFEQQISRIHALLEQPGSEVTWNDQLPDPDNPSQPRQIDVAIRRDDKLTLVECRIHAQRQDVQWIEGLIGRRVSLHADAVIAVSASGFTKGAVLKAKAFGVILRDFATLTQEEIAAWGHLTRVSLTFSSFHQVELTFRFLPDHLRELNVDQVEEALRKSPAQFYGIFELVARKIDDARLPQEMVCVFDAEIGKEGLSIAGKPVIRIDFHGKITRQDTVVSTPSVVAYDAPGVFGMDRQAFVEKVDLGEFEITSSANDVLVTIDLSPVRAPTAAKFHSVNLEFDRVVRMRAFEVIGLPRFRIELRDVRLRIAPFHEPRK